MGWNQQVLATAVGFVFTACAATQVEPKEPGEGQPSAMAQVQEDFSLCASTSKDCVSMKI
jgi:hypothetical protein